MKANTGKPGWTTRKVFAITLLLSTLWSAVLFHKTLSHGFVSSDDLTYIVRNPLTTKLDFEHLRRVFSETYFTDYLPILQIFLSIERTILGSQQDIKQAFDASGYHSVSILLHALNGSLLFMLLRSLVGKKKSLLLPSVVAVALFLSHPVQVETVAWIAQQKSLLSTAFLLGSVLCYVQFRRKERLSSFWYLSAVACGICALFSKSSAVVLPALLVLYDLCIKRRKLRHSLLATLPLILFTIVACFTTVLSQAQSGAISKDQGGPAVVMMITMLPVFADYLRLLLFPVGLAFFHHVPLRMSLISIPALAGLLVVALFVVSLVYCARRSRSVLFWWGWYFVALVPVMNIIPLNTLMAERYLYLPMAGIAGCIALAFKQFAERKSFSITSYNCTLACAVTILFLLSLTTMHQSSKWENDIVMWRTVLVTSPERPTSWYNVAQSYREAALQHDKKHPDLAISLRHRALLTYERALALSDRDPMFLCSMGSIRVELGKVEQAIPYFQKALEFHPEYAVAHASLGSVLVNQGDLVEGVKHLELALKYKDDSPDVQSQEQSLLRLLNDAKKRMGM